MYLPGSRDQRAKHHRRGARVVKRGVGRRHVQAELLYQSRQPWGLALWKFEHKPGQGRRIDDRMLERTFEPPSHQPRIERVMAVLHENGALCKTKERPAGVAEFRSSDQHRTIDVMALLRVRVDGGAAVDKSVEEGKRSRQLEPLRAQLQDQEGGVPCRLYVDRNELGIVEKRQRTQLRCIDGDLLPGNRLGGPAGLEIDRFHDGRLSNADRMNNISSRVIALRSTTAAA